MTEDLGELVPKAEVEELKGLMDLGKQALNAFAEQGEAQSRLASEQLKFAEKRLDAEKTAFIYKFGAIFTVILGVLGITTGLIFLKNDVASGVLILSHIFTLSAGTFAGWGWQRGHQ